MSYDVVLADRADHLLTFAQQMPCHHDEEHAGHPIRSEKVEPGGEQVLPDREQRKLDALRSRLDRNREADRPQS